MHAHSTARPPVKPDSSRPSSPSSPESLTRNERSLAAVATRLASKEGRQEQVRDLTIARWVHEEAAQFVGASVQICGPVLVKHIVRQRITVPRTAHHG